MRPGARSSIRLDPGVADSCRGTFAAMDTQRRNGLLRALTAAVAAGALALPASASAGLLDGSTIVDSTGTVIGTVDEVTGTVVDTTGQVIGTVDSTTGLVLDEAGGVVGLLPQGGGTGGSGSGGGAGGLPGASAPGAVILPGDGVLRLALAGRRTQRLGTVARRGVGLSARCSSSCGVFYALTVSRAAAEKLGLGTGARPAVVGQAIVGRAGGTRIRLTRRARRAISRALPSRATRAKVRRAKVSAARALRSGDSAGERRAARRRLSVLRRQERRWVRRSYLNVNAAALAVNAAGDMSWIRQRLVRVKR